MAEDTPKRERTEEATPRRREEARERGQVALSSELVAAVALAGGFGAIVLAGGPLARTAGLLVSGAARDIGVDPLAELSVPSAAGVVAEAARVAGLSAVAIVLPLFLVVVLAAYGQVGLRITPKAVGWNPARLDPFQNVQRLLSTRSVVRTCAALLKIFLIVATMAAIAWRELPGVAALTSSDLGPLLAGVGRVALRSTAGALVAIAAIAILDFGFQRWQHERDLRMTKKELRDELKNTEGDPLLKSRIRQIQRELARRRMMAEVPKATVVVTNPTHYAVALRYERGTESPRAPRVAAKGADHVARRIREVATEAGVPIYEEPALARALHAQVEIGDEIPERLYQAVASVLAYVYRVRGAGAVA